MSAVAVTTPVTFGYLPRPGHDPHRGVEFVARSSRPSPTAVLDLRALAPVARFQGSVGACTGFSSRGALRGLMAAAQAGGLWNGPAFDPSPLAIYTAARSRTGSLSIDGGASLSTIVEVLERYIPDERDWPFVPARWEFLPPPGVWIRATAHRLVNATPLRHQLDALRDAFADGCPVLVGLPVFDDARGMTSSAAFADGDVGMPTSKAAIVGWHAVSVWGHDPSRDVVFFQNSWEGWASASNGLGTLPTAYVLHLANEIYALGAIR